MLENHFTIVQVANQLDVRPRDISDLFYNRHLDIRRCRIVRNKKYIPANYVDEIRRVLIERGRIHDQHPLTASA